MVDQVGGTEDAVPHLIFLGTLLVQSVALVVASPVTGGGLSDRVGRRKVFVVVAGAVHALAMLVIATAEGRVRAKDLGVLGTSRASCVRPRTAAAPVVLGLSGDKLRGPLPRGGRLRPAGSVASLPIRRVR